MPPRQGPYSADHLLAVRDLVGNRRGGTLENLARTVAAAKRAPAANVGRDAIYEANRVDFDLVRTTEKFATADGGEFELDLAEPGLLIEHVVRSSDALRELFTFVLQRNTQPLKVSIYVSTAGRRRAGQR